MKNTAIVFAAWLFAAAISYGQEKELPQLSVTRIRAGQSYATDGAGNTWGKIIQVIDDDNMIVGIDNGGGSAGGNPRYSIFVWCKFRTKGLTDGQTGFLADFLGTGKVTASRTTRYNTAGGGTRTVFVFEPYKGELGSSRTKTLEQIRAEVTAADAAARTRMKKDEMPQAVVDWIVYYVNRGPVGSPALNDADLASALRAIGTPEVRNWLRLEAIYIWERDKGNGR